MTDCLEACESAETDVHSDAVPGRMLLLLLVFPDQLVDDPPGSKTGDGSETTTELSSLRFCFITSA